MADKSEKLTINVRLDLSRPHSPHHHLSCRRTRRSGAAAAVIRRRPTGRADVTPPKALPWTTTAPPACPKH